MHERFEDAEKKEMPLPRFFLYMDILGTKDLVDQKSANTLLLVELTEKFLSNKREHKVEFEKFDDGMFDITAFEPEISSDSDHINVSFPATEIFPFNQNTEIFIINTLVGIAAQIHLLALSKGILMRGGVAKDWQRHVGNNVIGKAQVEAVVLEAKARYPRVIIAKNLVRLFEKYTPVVRKDFDGEYFIDYLRLILPQGAVINDALIPALLNMRSIIEGGLTSKSVINNKKVKEKWWWLAETFNEYIDYCQRFESLRHKLANIRKFDTSPKVKGKKVKTIVNFWIMVLLGYLKRELSKVWKMVSNLRL